jgi:hypothetical protein
MVRQGRWIGAIVLALLGVPFLTVLPVYACSAGLDFNPVAEADYIVGGRVTTWERLAIEAQSPFIPIQVTMEVDQHWKGTTATTIQFIDHTSLTSSATSEAWVGSSGACGLFDSEPTGQYLVLGFDTPSDGTYRSNLLLLFFRGPEPSGDGYRQATHWLRAMIQQLTPRSHQRDRLRLLCRQPSLPKHHLLHPPRFHFPPRPSPPSRWQCRLRAPHHSRSWRSWC